ncbi:hypothetical protein AAEO56_01835 [Flavobacterium sp. DGU11]|uniref:Abortive infection C-terminus n=1 Tax=Flavobacterium arundinis TaxID=3139143 RepID=A0ABU9HS53_9FLAO
MAIFNIFSKRQKSLRGEIPEVYQHNNIPQKLRIQIGHIFNELITDKHYIYDDAHNILCREYGKYTLDSNANSGFEAVLNYLVITKSTEEVIDIVEVVLKSIEIFNYSCNIWDRINPQDAIEELNIRFKESGVGYSYENGEVIRVDSTYTHIEITKPTIALLWNNKFLGANEEYMKAHQHYKDGRNKECLADCLKAFESTLKIICDEKGWIFGATDTSKKLIQICFQNGLVPTFTQNQFTSLQNLLESGIPTIRNKLGGHGQGNIPQKVDDEMTRYAMNLTGSNIIFLIEQSKII